MNPLIRDADAAAARGDRAEALQLLERAVAGKGVASDHWLRLAAMRRADGDLRAALEAVHGALALAPLDFTALLMRASLLDRLDSGEAGEAYARALAQRPPGDLPPALAATLARGEQLAGDAQAARERVLSAAASQLDASPIVAARLSRFRSNIVRRTRPYHSEPSHYHYPGLVEREFHDREDFSWLAELEAATAAIAAEFRAVAAAERAELVPYIQYEAHEPLAQWRPLNHSRDWTAIHLLQNGRSIDANARYCPQTMALLERLPQPDVPNCSPNAMFSLLAPGVAIPPHTGVANTRLICHLPLIVPTGCWFRVGAETRNWEVGQAFVFDDTIEHEAVNPSTELRVVFIFDVWHPGLAGDEQDAIAATMSADTQAVPQSL